MKKYSIGIDQGGFPYIYIEGKLLPYVKMDFNYKVIKFENKKIAAQLYSPDNKTISINKGLKFFTSINKAVIK